MDFHRFRLSNGIPVVCISTFPGAPIALQVWFSCGARTETDAEQGLAHFNEHMFFRGGRDFPDAKSVEDELYLLGDNNDALTSDEYVLYSLVIGPQYFERAAHLLSDMLVYTKMDHEDFEKERGAVIQELKGCLDNPEFFAHLKFKNLLYGAHPLGREVVGTKETIASFTADDVKRYKERFYGPPNAVIVVAGGVDISAAGDILGRYFGAIPQKEKVVWVPFRAMRPALAAKCIVKKGVQQAHVHLGSIGPSLMSEDVDVAKVLHRIMTKRLYLKVRVEHSLAYAVGAEAHFESDTGASLFYAGVDADRLKITETLKLMLEEMAMVKSGGLTEEEIAAAKISYHNAASIAIGSSSTLAVFAASHELFRGKVQTLEELHQNIDLVTRERVLDLARILWREENVCSLLLTTSFPNYEKKFCELRKVLR